MSGIGRVTLVLLLLFFRLTAHEISASRDYPSQIAREHENVPKVSIKEYMRQAAINSADLKSAYNDWRAAYFNMRYSDTLPDPNLSYGFFIQEVETRVGPQKQHLGISQTIPWFGKLKHRKNVAAQEVIVTEERFCWRYVILVDRLKRAFYDYYYIRRAIEITQENIHLLEMIESIARSWAKVGGSAADILQAQMAISKLKDDLDTLFERSKIAEVRINSILNHNVKEHVALPEDLLTALDTPDRGDERELTGSNPELRVLAAEIVKYRFVTRLARQNRFPDITVGLDWTKTDRALKHVPDNGKDALIARVSVNLPLWFSTYSSQESEASYFARSAEDLYEQKKYVIQADFEDLLLRYDEAERDIALYREELIPQATQTLFILQEAYRSGKSDFERYLDAQQLLLDYQLKLEKAISRRAAIISEYDALLGRRGY